MLLLVPLAFGGCEEPPEGLVAELYRPVGDGGEELLAAYHAFVARTEAERRAGLAALPPLDPRSALVIEFPLEGEVCISNGPVPYAIDALFFDASGTLRHAACALPPRDDTAICTDEVLRVVETRPALGCPWPEGTRLRLREGPRASVAQVPE